MKFKPSYKYKMDKEELANYLHVKRKGFNIAKNTKGNYTRKEKHQKKYI